MRLSGLPYAFSAITMASNQATQPRPQLYFCISHHCPNRRYDCCSEVTHTMLLRSTHPKSLCQTENGRPSPHPQTSGDPIDYSSLLVKLSTRAGDMASSRTRRPFRDDMRCPAYLPPRKGGSPSPGRGNALKQHRPVRLLQNAKEAARGHFNCHRPSTIRKSLSAALPSALSAGLYRSLSYAAIAFSRSSNSTMTTD
jgi:hypothetical protein